MRRFLFVLLLVFLARPAAAQNVPMFATGVLTPGHAVALSQTGFPGSAVVQDAGPALAGGFTELGITNDGTPFCIRDLSQTHLLCLGANVNGGGVISYNPIGDAAPQGLELILNGVSFPLPGPGGTGPLLLAPSLAVLEATSTAGSSYAMRCGYYESGDAPCLVYEASASACSLNGGAGDTGSQVKSANGLCWLAIFPTSGADIREWGADATGVSDATAAVQACLTHGGICLVPSTARVLINSNNLLIPAETMLQCVTTPSNNGALFSGSTTASAILLNPSHTIQASGNDATIQNCTIVPAGMTFPQTTSSGWTGTAFNSQNNTAVQLQGVTIAGFDVCFTMGTSIREVVNNGYFDCDGGTNAGTGSGVFSNAGDLGYLLNTKFQVLATSTACPNRLRGGVGILFTSDDGEWVDNVLAQDFAVADIEFINSADFLIGKIFTDYWRLGGGAGCSTNTSTGIISNNSSAIHIDHWSANSTNVGGHIFNSLAEATFYIGDLFINNLGGDGIQLGNTSGASQFLSSGTVIINSLRSNQGDLGPILGYAINYLDPGINSQSILVLNSAQLYTVRWNGSSGVAPYIHIPSTASANDIRINWEQVTTDLSPPIGFVGAPTITGCTGVGSGSCVLTGGFLTQLSANPFSGIVALEASGSPSASGSVTITFPYPANTWNCLVSGSVAQGFGGFTSDFWSAGFFSTIYDPTDTTIQIDWQQTAALTAAHVYGLAYQCSAQ
jgi:hypothetical protein